MRPFRRWAECTKATTPANGHWWSTGSAFPRRSITAPSISRVRALLEPGGLCVRHARSLSIGACRRERWWNRLLRPTGLLDPSSRCRPGQGQVDHLLARSGRNHTRGGVGPDDHLTKRMAEDLSEYYHDLASRYAISTPTLRRWNGRKSYAIFGSADSTYGSASSTSRRESASTTRRVALLTRSYWTKRAHSARIAR